MNKQAKKDRKQLEEDIKSLLVQFTSNNNDFMVTDIQIKNTTVTIAESGSEFLSMVDVSTTIELI